MEPSLEEVDFLRSYDATLANTHVKTNSPSNSVRLSQRLVLLYVLHCLMLLFYNLNASAIFWLFVLKIYPIFMLFLLNFVVVVAFY